MTLTLDKPTRAVACLVRFQKDRSSYKHRIEGATDGEDREGLYDPECTGWDFKPLSIDRELRYLRIAIDSAPEDHAEQTEVTLYADWPPRGSHGIHFHLLKKSPSVLTCIRGFLCCISGGQLTTILRTDQHFDLSQTPEGEPRRVRAKKRTVENRTGRTRILPGF